MLWSEYMFWYKHISIAQQPIPWSQSYDRKLQGQRHNNLHNYT
jgi:hypothetical protein